MKSKNFKFVKFIFINIYLIFNLNAIAALDNSYNCNGIGLSFIDKNLSSLSNTADQISCLNIKQSFHCDKMEADLEGEDKKKIIQCDKKSLNSNSISETNLASCIWNGFKISGENLVNMVKLPGAIAEVAIQGFKETQDCNNNLNKKREILNAFNMSVTDKRFKLEESFLGRSFNEMSCAELEKLTHARYENYTNLVSRENINAKNMGKNYKMPENLLAKNSDILQSLNEVFKEAGVTYNCYTPKAKAEMICAGVTSLLADLALGAGFSKAIGAVRNIAKSKRALSGIQRSVASGEKANLSEAGVLRTTDRVKAGEIVIGRSISKSEAEAIEAAHQVGLNEGRGFFTYTKEDIAKKAKILKDAGFSSEERRKLMENGITGKENDYYANLYMQGQVMKVEERSALIKYERGAASERMYHAQLGIEDALKKRDLASAEIIQTKLAETAKSFTTAEKVQAADYYLGRPLSADQKVLLTKAIESKDMLSLMGKGFSSTDIEKIHKTLGSERNIASVSKPQIDHAPRVKGESIISKFTSTGNKQSLNEGLAETRKFYKNFIDKKDTTALFTKDAEGLSNIMRANEYGLTAKEAAGAFKNTFGGAGKETAEAYRTALKNLNDTIREYDQALKSGKATVPESLEFKMYRAKELRGQLADDYFATKYPDKFGELDIEKMAESEHTLRGKWSEELMQAREKMKILKLPALE